MEDTDDDKIHIIAFSGYAQSGKDTAALHLIKHYGFQKIAFADPIREAIYTLDPYIPVDGGYSRLRDLVDYCGWEHAKTNHYEVRRLLQTYRTEVGRNLYGPNFWINLALEKIDSSCSSRFVVTDLRFENELRALKKRSAYLIKVERPGVGPVNEHISDQGLSSSSFNYVLHNNSTILDMCNVLDNICSNNNIERLDYVAKI